MLEPDALAAMAMAFATSAADMVAGVCTLHRDGQYLGRHMTTCGDGPLPLADLLDLDACWLRGQFFHQPEVMFTRTLWERAGANVDEGLFYSMDYDLWVRFAKAGRLHVIGRPIALFRVHEKQKTYQVGSYEPEFALSAIGMPREASSPPGSPSKRPAARICGSCSSTTLEMAAAPASRIGAWQRPWRWAAT